MSSTTGPSVRIPYTHPSLGAAFGEPITEADITFAIKREPVATRIVFAVAHDIFDSWFEVKDLAEKPDETLDRKIQAALLDLKAKDVFTQMSVFERGYGWAIIVIGYEDEGKTLADPLKKPTKIEELWPYAPTDITSIREDKKEDSERYGFPEYYFIKKPGMIRRLKVHHSRVLHFATRLLDHPYKGPSVLESVWDDLTTLRNVRWAMGQTMYRYGSGFPVVTVKGATKEQIDQ